LEGLPCDGYGYTVVISGPVKKRTRLRRRKSVQESTQQPILQKPKPARGSEQEKPAALDIAAVREVEVRESWHWPRISNSNFKPFDTRSIVSGDIEMGDTKNGKSWFQEE
jgi:hypothetical protein